MYTVLDTAAVDLFYVLRSSWWRGGRLGAWRLLKKEPAPDTDTDTVPDRGVTN